MSCFVGVEGLLASVLSPTPPLCLSTVIQIALPYCITPGSVELCSAQPGPLCMVALCQGPRLTETRKLVNKAS